VANEELWKYKQPPEPPDESWWQAVLTEEKYSGENGGSPIERVSAMSEAGWARVEALYEQEEIVNLQVVDYNRGGLLVNGDDITGFVPVSHLMKMKPDASLIDRERLLSSFIGCFLCLKVIECDPSRGRVVLSERAAQGQPGCRERLFGTLAIGQKWCGVVTNITNFGVFVDLGGVEGLVHVSELSWGRVRHPADVVKMGDRLDLLIMQVDSERGRVALSLKRLVHNPWEQARERYEINSVQEAEITSVVRFGAFARFPDGLEGLIHISEMGLSGYVKPWEVLREGQRVKVRVLHVDVERQRLGLSLESRFGAEGREAT
jgi:small subunit ribosomal protein S1